MNPFTDAHYDALNQIIENAVAAKQLAQRAIRAGAPFQEMEALADQQIEMASKLKAEFFPNKA